MHIKEGWVHASDLMKMMKSANSISTLSSEEGLPDNHVITIRERELTVDFPELIQNNIKTDTVTLDLDAEWDGIHPVIIFGPNASGTIAVEYTGEPVHIPGAVMQYVGGLDCSVMGLDDSGEVRLVTKAAPNTFEVVKSGEYIGQISEDDVSLLGQILSAIEDVKTATSDASTAAESATAAADSANTAATKATDAANSANTAAAKATAAANSANSASERAENAYDVLTPIIAEIGVNGNQPRATTNPNHVATASDAYAAKPLGICIKGATRQNLWVNPSGTSNGVIITSNEDGSVTISGTPTAYAELYTPPLYTLVQGKTYVKTESADPGGFGFACVFFDSDGTSIGNMSTSVITVPKNCAYVKFRYSCNNASNKPVLGTYHVMLNEGSTAQPWCPPGLNSVGDDGSVKVVTAGKNLLARMGRDLPYTTAGITFSDNGDGGIRVSGTATAAAYYGFFNKVAQTAPYITSGTYVASLVGGIMNILNLNVGYFDYGIGEDYTSWISTHVTGISSTGSIDRPAYIRAFISVASGATINTVVYPQLELGSTATAYEPPTVTTTPLPEVELRSLPNGTCDDLVIKADGTCVVGRRTVEVTFDGSEDEGWVLNTSNNGHGIANFRTNSSRYSTLKASVVCDTLPVDNAFQANATRAGILMADNALYIRLPSTTADTVKELRTWLKTNPTTVVFTNSRIGYTEPQSPVTLPTLPSPNISVYHDSDVPSDITVEYVQDINIVLDNLNAKIAALNVAQSSSS